MEMNVTERALEQLNELVEEKQVSKNVRVYIAGVGWGGPTFGLALEEPKEEDIVEKVGDINFVLSPDMGGNFTCINIDYGSGFLSRGFTITGNRN